MDRNIKIEIKDRVAHLVGTPKIICGNNDYSVTFTFDDEWTGVDVKTLRVSYNGKYSDHVFSGDTVDLPPIIKAVEVYLGVFAGDITSTKVAVRAEPSILCAGGSVADPEPDVYDQIIDLINAGMLKGDPGEPGPAGKDGEKGEKGDPGKDAVSEVTREEFERLNEEKADYFEVGDGLTMSDDRVLSVHDDMRVLIDTITVEEDVAEITLNYEPDGTRYNFSSVSLRVTFPACGNSGNVQVVFWVNGDWRKALTSYFINSYNANNAKVGYTKAWLDDGRWRNGWWNCVNGPGDVANYCENPYYLDRYSVEDGYIRTIKLVHGTAIPAGTIIELFGVRV